MLEGITLYNQYRDKIKTADIIEWQGNSLIGVAVRAKTDQNVQHTSGAILYQMVNGTEVRRYIGESNEKGFQLHYLSDVLKGYDGKVFWSRLKPEYDSYRVRIAEEATKLEGRGYGFLDLFSLLVKPVRLDAKSVICSEAWQIALINAGLLDKNFNDGNVLVPGQFGLTGLFYNPIRIY